MTVLMDTIKGGKTTKIDRYGWEVRDQPGRMQMIDKHELIVDRTYQRDLKDHASRDMASDWSWYACGVIVVAERDGKLYVVDGQHRVCAAMRRSDIRSLPCMVFQSTGVEQEASAFLVIQTKRKPVTAVEKFRARVAIGDQDALLVEDLVREANRTMDRTPKPTTVHCAGVLLSLVSRNAEELNRVWPLVIKLFEGQSMGADIIRALVYIESRMPEGTSITQEPWRSRLLRIGAEDLQRFARRSAASHGTGTDRTWAIGIMDAINKGCRNRLELTK